MTKINNLVNECLSCSRPRCETGCPLDNHIKDYILALKNEDLALAASYLYSQNPFPEMTSLLCDYKRQCRGKCIKGIKGESVLIPSIENYIALNSERDLNIDQEIDYKVAIVGSGPAALSLAYFLRKKGAFVTIYEKEKMIGGAVYTGVPSFRYDKKYLIKIQNDLEKMGIIFNLNYEIKDINSLKDKYNDIVLAIGANKDNEVVPTNNANILSGLKFLYDVNVKKKAHLYQSNEYAYIMGGGNVAIDCARSLIRIRDKVALIYRRDKDDMPANEDEIRSALDEGIEFYLLTDIKEVSEEDGLLQINCCHYYKDGKNEDGRSIIKELANSSFSLKGDLLVTAVGQKRNLDSFNIEVLLNHETNDKHVFVVGDAYYGPKNVAAAIKDGRELASRLIGGRDGI